MADLTFGNSGIQTSPFDLRSVAIQDDGKIVVTGGKSSEFMVARYKANGSIDSTFNGNSTVVTNFEFKIPCDFKECQDSEIIRSGIANTICIQKNSKIILGGTAFKMNSPGLCFAIARYNTDGSPDSTFNGDGKLLGNFKQGGTTFNSTAIQTDGK